MGSVMSYALGLGPDRPAPAGILAFSGFVPTVEGWAPALTAATRVFVAHGRDDPIIEVGFARSGASCSSMPGWTSSITRATTATGSSLPPSPPPRGGSGAPEPIGLRCELVGEGCPERLGVVRERLARGRMVLPVRKRTEEVFLALTVEVDRPESSPFSK